MLREIVFIVSSLLEESFGKNFDWSKVVIDIKFKIIIKGGLKGVIQVNFHSTKCFWSTKIQKF